MITGGPGSGKSSLIAALKRPGVACMPEAGRAIIRDQVAIGGTAVPWADVLAFADQMLVHDTRTYRIAEATDGLVLFDRGIPDVIGYRRLVGLPVPDHLARAAKLFRYNRMVFVAPPWRAIFHQDTERKQGFEEAEATYRAMTEVYAGLGYEALALPLASIEVRTAFVVEVIERRMARGESHVSEGMPSR